MIQLPRVVLAETKLMTIFEAQENNYLVFPLHTCSKVNTGFQRNELRNMTKSWGIEGMGEEIELCRLSKKGNKIINCHI